MTIKKGDKVLYVRSRYGQAGIEIVTIREVAKGRFGEEIFYTEEDDGYIDSGIYTKEAILEMFNEEKTPHYDLTIADRHDVTKGATIHCGLTKEDIIGVVGLPDKEDFEEGWWKDEVYEYKWVKL